MDQQTPETEIKEIEEKPDKNEQLQQYAAEKSNKQQAGQKKKTKNIQLSEFWTRCKEK